MARKSYTDEFKIAAARLVREQGSSVKAAGERLGVDPCSVRDWVRRFAPEPAAANPEASAEQLRQENLRLREENRRLLMEREILKKRRPSSRGSSREVRLHPRPPGRVPRRGPLRRAGGLA